MGASTFLESTFISEPARQPDEAALVRQLKMFHLLSSSSLARSVATAALEQDAPQGDEEAHSIGKR
jgi:hypothetical protein